MANKKNFENLILIECRVSKNIHELTLSVKNSNQVKNTGTVPTPQSYPSWNTVINRKASEFSQRFFLPQFQKSTFHEDFNEDEKHTASNTILLQSRKESKSHGGSAVKNTGSRRHQTVLNSI